MQEPKIRDLKPEMPCYEWFVRLLGLFEPTEDELAMVTEIFDLQKLQVEDAANPTQRPKSRYDTALRDGAAQGPRLRGQHVRRPSGQLAVFIGPWYAVTVRYGQLGDLRGIRREAFEESPELSPPGPVSVVYAVLDQIVDGYLSVTDEVGIDVENLRVRSFHQGRGQHAERRLPAKARERRGAARGRTSRAVYIFVSGQAAWIPADLRPYFRDIGDHILRVTDSVESADNLLMTMLMASTSLQDLQQNGDMRRVRRLGSRSPRCRRLSPVCTA